MTGLSPVERSIAFAEIRKFLKRTLRRSVRFGRRKILVVAAIGVGAVAVGSASGPGRGAVVAATGLILGLLVVLLLEVWRSRSLLSRFADRAGLRRLGSASRYELRSPRVGRLVASAQSGHHRRAISGLIEIRDRASASRTERSDAGRGLVDFYLTSGAVDQAVSALDQVPFAHESPEYWGLAIEVATLTGTVSSLLIPAEIRKEMAKDPHLKYLLSNTDPVSERLAVVTSAVADEGFGPVGAVGNEFCGLYSEPGTGSDALIGDLPLVTVIMPAHNAESTIGAAINSLRAQTWPALEILVVDDASSDATAEVVAQIAAQDPRVRLIERTVNGGAYRSRNTGLEAARGAFITVNDGDDWAHCEKISAQARHLHEHPEVVANLSSMIRCTQDLLITRRGTTHSDVCGINYSSLMVRRSAIDEVGPWDDVVVEADSEMLGRLRARFGRKAVAQIHSQAPLSITLRSATSLSQASVTGLGSHRHSTGVRKIYGDAYRNWHSSIAFADDLPLSRSSDTQPFPAPPLVRRRGDSQHHLDVVLMSDLGLPGGTTSSNLTEIQANEHHHLQTGLIHNRNPRFADEGVNPKFFSAHSSLTRLITAGETVSTDLMVIKYPPTAVQIPDVFPEITVHGEVVMVVNQTPMTSYQGSDRRLVYRIEEVNAEVVRAFGKEPLWVPAGPAVREVLEQYHGEEIAGVRCGDADWVEIIDLGKWMRATRPDWVGERPVRIGRHGRDSQWKWPENRSGILEVYPDDPAVEVRILGGAEVARQRIGSLPQNWKVLEFDAVAPEHWLAELDVFVSFPHPDMVEAFGRTLLEALAVGVPVVTDTRFAELFGDAVIACEPAAARAEVQALMNDEVAYAEMVRRGHALVQDRFGFEAHLRRLRLMGLTR